MIDKLHNPLTLAGRLLMAILFLPAAISKLTHFGASVNYAAAGGMPMPEVGISIAIAVELFGSLALIFGWQTRWAALVLSVFTLAATLMFHNFWALPAAQAMLQQQAFMKNIAVIGGLLTLAAWGAGSLSLDARRGRAG